MKSEEFRDTARSLHAAIWADRQPISAATIAFGIDSHKKFSAIYCAVRNGDLSVEQLDDVAGDGRKITDLVNSVPGSNPQGLTYRTVWEEIHGDHTHHEKPALAKDVREKIFGFAHESVPEFAKAEVILQSAKGIVKDNLTEHFVHFAVVSQHLGVDASARILQGLDRECPTGRDGKSVYTALVRHLIYPRPNDLEHFTDDQIRDMSGGWGYWCNVQHECDYMGAMIADRLYPLKLRNHMDTKVENWFERGLEKVKKWGKEQER